ncbi:MAG: hypothetical protein ACC645_06065 [Pirellulales bacterium]
MHFLSPQVFSDTAASFLGPYYIILAVMNGVAAFYLWRNGRGTQALFWLMVSGCFVVLAPLAGSANPAWMPSIPESIQSFVNDHTGPVVYSVGTTLLLVVLFLGRKFFVQPPVAWAMLNLALLTLGLSMTNKDFFAIVAKPDNVPIVALVFLLGFFTWLGTSQAVRNDDRALRGLPPLEKENSEKVLVWPDLVYIELICMVLSFRRKIPA